MGISDMEREGHWVTKDNKEVEHRWSHGEPNGDRSENCVAALEDGSWNDDNCHGHKWYICEKYKGV